MSWSKMVSMSGEANVIAESYFLRFGPGCGGVAGVIPDEKFWIGRTAVGYGGLPTKEPIRIADGGK